MERWLPASPGEETGQRQDKQGDGRLLRPPRRDWGQRGGCSLSLKVGSQRVGGGGSPLKEPLLSEHHLPPVTRCPALRGGPPLPHTNQTVWPDGQDRAWGNSGCPGDKGCSAEGFQPQNKGPWGSPRSHLPLCPPRDPHKARGLVTVGVPNRLDSDRRSCHFFLPSTLQRRQMAPFHR